ncbi:hypothetical protein [Natrinema halophilum]|uniref:Uncharacterized protein n=1 Tax=Natrinema halophilum TaxID=1699371 RepID=A0A7D5GL91_9EURY|nr:hypothetical protein [Natrinema halophilum]QLG49690.1 hypothetical protein HYG82_12870 [Natrinema halophilum]
MEFETGFTKYPKMSVFMLVFAIFLMASSIYFEGIDGILRVDNFWETAIFFSAGAMGLISLSALVWVVFLKES